MAGRLVNDCQAAAVVASKSWPPELRCACLALLDDAARRIGEAAAVWQEATAAPDESGVRFTAILHIGSERAKTLQRLYFDQKELAGALTEKTGIAWRDALGMDDSIAIVQPYDQFRAEESIHDRARAALRTLRERACRLEATIARIRDGAAGEHGTAGDGQQATAGEHGAAAGRRAGAGEGHEAPATGRTAATDG